MSGKTSARQRMKRRGSNGDSWVSNNRVLNRNATKKNGSFARNPNFDTDETKLLIQLWGDPKVQRTLITTHKKHAVICQLASKMREFGYYRSPEEITTRIKNMKCFYNRLKKEMESGQTASSGEPTWKHFAEMDAIMTRPIFSVRPNEVPAPSLKYQMEQAREEREERRKKILAEGGAVSDSDDGLDDVVANQKSNDTNQEIDDGIIPDAEVDINDEAFAAIANAATEKTSPTTSRDFDDDSDDELSKDQLQIKEEYLSGDETVTNEYRIDKQQKLLKEAEKLSAALIIPKEEPIDVDAEEEEEDDSCSGRDNDTSPTAANVKALMPTLVDMLQLSKATVSAANNIVTVTTTTTATTTPAIITPIKLNSINTTAATTPAATASSITTTTTPTQGKISLVPTNFLLQPKSTHTPPLLTLSQTQPSKQQPQEFQILSSGALSVPTTTLLQTNTQPPCIVLSGAQSAQLAAGNTSGLVTTATAGGMKLLLMNTDSRGTMKPISADLAQQLNANNCQLSKTISAMLPINTTANTIYQTQQQQQQQQQRQQQQQQQQQLKVAPQQPKLPQQQPEKQQKSAQQQQQKRSTHNGSERSTTRRDESPMTKKDATSMRILLRQLLNAQNEQNDVQRKRLKLERERFDYEKTIAERFLTMLPTVFTQQQQQHQLQQPLLSQPTQTIPLQQSQQPQQLLLQHLPHAQASQIAMQSVRINPPKLLFGNATTLAVSSSAGTTATVVSLPTLTGATLVTPTTTLNTLANTLPKVVTAVQTKSIEICKSTNDLPLLTPKLEKDD